MDFREKMHSGALYQCMDEAILVEQFQCLDRLYDFNQTRPTQQDKRTAMLKEMLAEVGEGCYVEAPLHANWGGKHIHFGKYVYCNFNWGLHRAGPQCGHRHGGPPHPPRAAGAGVPV